MKLCRTCQTEKPLEDFPRDKNGSQGRNHRCRPCTSAYNAEYASRLRDRPRPVVTEKRCPTCENVKPADKFYKNPARPDGLSAYCKSCKLWRDRSAKYGISKPEHVRMTVEQAARCAICRTPSWNLHIDHCHTTGRVRGLLCGPCNTGLGHFKDDPARLAAAIEYLGAP